MPTSSPPLATEMRVPSGRVTVSTAGRPASRPGERKVASASKRRVPCAWLPCACPTSSKNLRWTFASGIGVHWRSRMPIVKRFGPVTSSDEAITGRRLPPGGQAGPARSGVAAAACVAAGALAGALAPAAVLFLPPPQASNAREPQRTAASGHLPAAANRPVAPSRITAHLRPADPATSDTLPRPPPILADCLLHNQCARHLRRMHVAVEVVGAGLADREGHRAALAAVGQIGLDLLAAVVLHVEQVPVVDRLAVILDGQGR